MSDYDEYYPGEDSSRSDRRGRKQKSSSRQSRSVREDQDTFTRMQTSKVETMDNSRRSDPPLGPSVLPIRTSARKQSRDKLTIDLTGDSVVQISEGSRTTLVPSQVRARTPPPAVGTRLKQVRDDIEDDRYVELPVRYADEDDSPRTSQRLPRSREDRKNRTYEGTGRRGPQSPEASRLDRQNETFGASRQSQRRDTTDTSILPSRHKPRASTEAAYELPRTQKQHKNRRQVRDRSSDGPYSEEHQKTPRGCKEYGNKTGARESSKPYYDDNFPGHAPMQKSPEGPYHRYANAERITTTSSTDRPGSLSHRRDARESPLDQQWYDETVHSTPSRNYGEMQPTRRNRPTPLDRSGDRQRQNPYSQPTTSTFTGKLDTDHYGTRTEKGWSQQLEPVTPEDSISIVAQRASGWAKPEPCWPVGTRPLSYNDVWFDVPNNVPPELFYRQMLDTDQRAGRR